MLLAAAGRHLPVLKAKPGVSWAHMGRDVVAALQEFRRGTLTAREYFRSLRGPVQFAVAAPDDPLPALMDVPLLLQRLWKRGRVG
jgi:predicted ATP-grasp superfamily ATP-dependent carboligase